MSGQTPVIFPGNQSQRPVSRRSEVRTASKRSSPRSKPLCPRPEATRCNVRALAHRLELLPHHQSGVSEQWLGFSGAFIGGLTTAGAGLAAWIAAQRTIEINRTIAERKELATYSLLQTELLPRVELFVRYWRVIQRASKGKNEIKKNGEVLIRAIASNDISDDWLDEMRRLGSDLGPIQRRQLIDVLLGMRLVRERLKAESGEHVTSSHFYLVNLRTMLSHFDRYLQAFDPEMAKRFKGFTKSNIDARTLAEHIDPLVETFEQTGGVN